METDENKVIEYEKTKALSDLPAGGCGVVRLLRGGEEFAHPFWGLVLLLSTYGLVFWLTYAAATPFVGFGVSVPGILGGRYVTTICF